MGTPAEIAAEIFPIAFRIIGAIMVILGGVQTFLAFNRNEAHDQVKGMWLLIAGAGVLGLGFAIDAGALSDLADEAPDAVVAFEDGGLWEKITSTMEPWVQALGAIAMVWGGFQVFEAFRNDDAGQKIKGLKFLIAGVILWQIVHIMGQILAP